MPRSGALRARLRAGASVTLVVLVHALGIGALAAPSARADAAALRLHWQAPAECPDEAYVRRAIDELLAGSSGPASAVECDARVARGAGGRYRVTLGLRRDGAPSERSVEAASCRSLADATALIVALTIDPARVAANRTSSQVASETVGDAGTPVAVADGSGMTDADAGERAVAAQGLDASAPPSALDGASPPAASATSPDAGPQITPSPLPTATQEKPVARRSESAGAGAAKPAGESEVPQPASGRRVGGAAFVAAAGDVGSLPKATVGGVAGAALTLGALRIDAYGSLWAPSKVHAAFTAIGLEAGLWTAGARGCYVPLRRRFTVAACSGLEGGVLRVSSFGGVASPGKIDNPWFAGTAAAHVAWNATRRFSVILEAGVVVPFLRTSFELPPASSGVSLMSATSTSATFQPFPVVGRVWLGPEVRF